MFENITKFFKKFGKNEKESSKNTAKERLHLVLAQDRANISADFLEMMKQEIIEVIKKYIDIDEAAIDVRMTNKPGEDGTVGAPSLYANIPIVTIKNEARKLEGTVVEKKEDKKEDNLQEQEHETENETEQKNDEVEENKTEEHENKIEEKETIKQEIESEENIDKKEVQEVQENKEELKEQEESGNDKKQVAEKSKNKTNSKKKKKSKRG